ncbi:MAG TPA: MFS transporter [Gemmatimonadaceae bacterium]|jgi:multidrug resistance protein|nr:MFS transporter [Gemmatimonadaceae bacterium]
MTPRNTETRPPKQPGKKTDVAKLTVLMITAFIDMVGVLMIIPLMPFYAKAFGANGFVVGLLVSSFSVAQLLSAPIWGRFSDRYGRRPALIVGMTASAIAYVVFAYSNSLWLLFLSRLIQGSGGGTVSVIQAYVADAVEPEHRAKGLGWLSAATNAGVALGPVVGGQALHFWGAHGPGLAAATLCVINIVFAFRFLAESRDMVEAKSSVHVPGRSAKALLRVVTHSSEPAPRLIWIYAIGIGAFQGLNAILALFLAARFGVTTNTIQYFYFYIGTISMLTRALLLGRAVDHFGEARLSRLGQALLALGLATLPFIHLLSDPAAVAAHLGGVLPVSAVAVLPFVPLALAVALLPLGTAFTFPCVTALLSRVIPSSERGLYMGVQQTFGGISRVLFPPLLGWLFDRYTDLPFFVSATLVAGTILLGLGMEEYTRTKREPQAASAA